MKKVIIALLVFFNSVAHSQDLVINDANAEERNISGSFTGISVSDGIKLYLTQGSEDKIAVSASETKFRDKIQTEIVNGVLKIYYKTDTKIKLNVSLKEKKELIAYVSFKNINKIIAGAGANVKVSGLLNTTDLSLEFSSGSAFEANVKANNITANQNSGSIIKITGDVSNLNVQTNSGAMFNSYELNSDFCTAKTTSGAAIKITINKELNAKATSGGSIKYKGGALIKEINVNSGGSVKKA